MKLQQLFLYSISVTFLAGIIINFGGCDPAYEDLPPADPSAATTQMYLNFGVSFRYDTVNGKSDPCRYFDGVSSSAAQVIAEVLIPSAEEVGGVADLYPPQTFIDGKDFNRDPNGIGIRVPQKGGYFMVITVIGYPSPDCCPGPPVGRPVYRTIWPYSETDMGFRLRHILPQFQYCLYI